MIEVKRLFLMMVDGIAVCISCLTTVWLAFVGLSCLSISGYSWLPTSWLFEYYERVGMGWLILGTSSAEQDKDEGVFSGALVLSSLSVSTLIQAWFFGCRVG